MPYPGADPVEKIIRRNFAKPIDKRKKVCYNIIAVSKRLCVRLTDDAGVAELADARDLKSRETFSRTGSSPVSGTSTFIGAYIAR